ncbi:MAG: hypothetical protein ABS939_00040 [Psychrobacillus sp.]
MDRNEKRTLCKTRLFQYRESLANANELPFSVQMEKWNVKWDGRILTVYDLESLLATADEHSIALDESISDFYHFPLDLLEVMIDNRGNTCYN